eukprot:542881-Pyramimonas_sp.AAC.1
MVTWQVTPVRANEPITGLHLTPEDPVRYMRVDVPAYASQLYLKVNKSADSTAISGAGVMIAVCPSQRQPLSGVRRA